MSTHNICICREIRKILCGYPLLSVAMDNRKKTTPESRTFASQLINLLMDICSLPPPPPPPPHTHTKLKMQPGHLPPRAYFWCGCLPTSVYFANGRLPQTPAPLLISERDMPPPPPHTPTLTKIYLLVNYHQNNKMLSNE